MAEATTEEAASVPRRGLLSGLVRTIRPHQWVKNLFVLAPIFFAKNVFHPELLVRALAAVGIFCILSGAVYTLNDVVDADADRLHPEKRKRPIASGQVSVSTAKTFLVVLLLVAFGAALAALQVRFVLVAAAYFTLNVAYSLKLKKIPFIDVLCIAGGFVLRVLGGGFAINVKVSWYMFACTFLLALFLGLGKRRHEIAQEHAGKTRKALEAYTARGLNAALAITGTLTVGTYLAYTLDPATRTFFRSNELWMTTPQVITGVVRFIEIVRGHPKSESPTQEMLRDSLFVLNVVAWIIVVLVIVYRLRPTATP
jgi:decaprenyl-phosphate phosphoribosyltransferase